MNEQTALTSQQKWNKKNPERISAINKRWKKNHPDKVKAQKEKWTREHPGIFMEYARGRAKKNRIWINAYKGELGCSMCPEKDYRCLDFHHIDPKEKCAAVSRMYGYAPDAIRAEIGKCVLLCANCHRKMTERPFIGRIGSS